MEPWQLLLLFVAGVAAGWVNTLAGGGSILTVPVMVFLGLPGPVANGTNRIGIIAQNVASVWGFFRRGFSDFKLSASLSACAAVGAFFGANAGVRLEGVWFERTRAAMSMGRKVSATVVLAVSKSAERNKRSARAAWTRTGSGANSASACANAATSA